MAAIFAARQLGQMSDNSDGMPRPSFDAETAVQCLLPGADIRDIVRARSRLAAAGNVLPRRLSKHLCQSLAESDVTCGMNLAVLSVSVMQHVRAIMLRKRVVAVCSDNRVGVDAGLCPLRDAVRAEPCLFNSLIRLW